MTSDDDQRRTSQVKSTITFLFGRKLTHSLSIKEYWEQTSMIWLWVMAEASRPRRESGTVSRILQSTSCLTPPTLRLTLRFFLRPLRIRKLLSELSEGFPSRPEAAWSSLKWEKYFIHGLYMMRKSFQFAKFISLLSPAQQKIRKEEMSQKYFYQFLRYFYEQLLEMLYLVLSRWLSLSRAISMWSFISSKFLEKFVTDGSSLRTSLCFSSLESPLNTFWNIRWR